MGMHMGQRSNTDGEDQEAEEEDDTGEADYGEDPHLGRVFPDGFGGLYCEFQLRHDEFIAKFVNRIARHGILFKGVRVDSRNVDGNFVLI